MQIHNTRTEQNLNEKSHKKPRVNGEALKELKGPCVRVSYPSQSTNPTSLKELLNRNEIFSLHARMSFE